LRTLDQIREAKIQTDINDVDICLKHLLREGRSLDDLQLLLLCTQEDVRKFVELIQEKQPQYWEVIMRNMNIARFPYMETIDTVTIETETIEPAKSDVSPEGTPNLTGAALVLLAFGLGGLLIVRRWVVK
jgi:hypothetical protein